MKKRKIAVLALVCMFLVAVMVIPAITSFADNDDNVADLKKEIEALKAEVADLKSEKNAGISTSSNDPTGLWGQRPSSFWDPFAEMRQMQSRMNRLFNDSFMRSSLFNDTATGMGFGSFYEPELEIREHDDHYELSLDLPGLDKNKIDLKVTEHAITISGERRFEKREEDDKKGFYRMEKSYGSFHRSIPIPDDANSEEVNADYKDGVLNITIGKKVKESEGKEERKIQIT